MSKTLSEIISELSEDRQQSIKSRTDELLNQELYQNQTTLDHDENLWGLCKHIDSDNNE